MSKQRSFLQCWLFVCWLPIVGAFVVIPVQALRITGKPQTFISLAKVEAGTRMAANTRSGIQDRLDLTDFYGTIIETIESSEMRRRALDRVRALHPELKECEVEIQASQNRGSVIFSVRAIGSEPKYTRIFLDALLDEFMAYRNQIREQRRNKALTTLAEDVARREKILKERQERLTDFEKASNVVLLIGELNRLTKRTLNLRDERDDLNRKIVRGATGTESIEKQLASTTDELARVEKEIEPLTVKVATHEGLTKDYQDSKRAYHDILDLVRRFTVNEELITDHVAILERASGAVEDLQDWILPLGGGAVAGGLAGLLLSLLIAWVIYAAGDDAEPPALPAAE